MIIIRIIGLLFFIFLAYWVLDVIIPSFRNKPTFTLFRYIFKGKDYDEEVTEYDEQEKN